MPHRGYSLRRTLRQDFARNRDWLARAVLVVFRYGQWTSRRRGLVRGLVAVPHKAANLLLLRLGVGCDLPAQTRCGPGLRLHHAGRGVAVHRRAVLGANVTLFQDVAIGQRDHSGEPVLGDDVIVGAGARLLGPIQIGDGARVGANAVVLDDVPSGGVAIAPRARVRLAAPPVPPTQPGPSAVAG